MVHVCDILMYGKYSIHILYIIHEYICNAAYIYIYVHICINIFCFISNYIYIHISHFKRQASNQASRAAEGLGRSYLTRDSHCSGGRVCTRLPR